MSRITIDLLRKRSEHNEGILSTLEELTLHQYEIEKIELINQHCRKLKILFLQNNIISKIENLHRLKELEYLNLALNNIQVIENLSSCEMLKKLDLTVNFIYLHNFKVSIDELKLCYNLRELFLLGNPCSDWNGYKQYIIASLPQLISLDGKDITISMRLEAKSNLEKLSKELNEIKPEIKESTYTPEYRVEMYKKLAKEKREKEEYQKNIFKSKLNEDPMLEYRKKKSEFQEISSDGSLPRQRNIGNFDYKFIENRKNNKNRIILEVEFPKYLSTSSIEIDIQPLYIQIRAQGKLLLLHLPSEVSIEQSKAERRISDGALEIIMPVLDHNFSLNYKTEEKIPKKIQKKIQKLDIESDFEDDEDVPPLEKV